MMFVLETGCICLGRAEGSEVTLWSQKIPLTSQAGIANIKEGSAPIGNTG